MRFILPAVHKNDGDSANALLMSRQEGGSSGLQIDWRQHLPRCRHSLLDLYDLGIKRLGKANSAGEDFRARLVADPEGIAEAGGDGQEHAFALALEQRIGRHRRPHFHGADRASAFTFNDRLDSGDSGIVVETGIIRQQLADDQATVR